MVLVDVHQRGGLRLGLQLFDAVGLLRSDDQVQQSVHGHGSGDLRDWLQLHQRQLRAPWQPRRSL